MSTFPDGVAFPMLSPAELERVEAYGTVRNVTGGDLLFAPGDASYVRRGSIKRVAAAVGEGASAIRSAHQYLAVQGARTVGASVTAGAERRES